MRTAVARVLASVALASARAGQSERSRQEARAALALDESPPEAYLALGEYQFQNNTNRCGPKSRCQPLHNTTWTG